MRLQSTETQFNNVKIFMGEYPEDILNRLLPTIIDRISTYGELNEIKNSEFGFFIKIPDYNVEKITWKDAGKTEASQNLKSVKELIVNADFSSPDTIKQAIMSYAEEKGKGNVLWPLRMSLSGQEKSVDPFTICYILGSDEVIKRIDLACQLLDA
jgi:glutamyl/glutaminyl-tRNA synthetase